MKKLSQIETCVAELRRLVRLDELGRDVRAAVAPPGSRPADSILPMSADIQSTRTTPTGSRLASVTPESSLEEP